MKMAPFLFKKILAFAQTLLKFRFISINASDMPVNISYENG